MGRWWRSSAASSAGPAGGEVLLDEVERCFRKAGGRAQSKWVVLHLAVLERLETVREDMARELALVREGRAAVHARIEARRAAPLLQAQRLPTDTGQVAHHTAQ